MVIDFTKPKVWYGNWYEGFGTVTVPNSPLVKAYSLCYNVSFNGKWKNKKIISERELVCQLDLRVFFFICEWEVLGLNLVDCEFNIKLGCPLFGLATLSVKYIVVLKKKIHALFFVYDHPIEYIKQNQQLGMGNGYGRRVTVVIYP